MRFGLLELSPRKSEILPEGYSLKNREGVTLAASIEDVSVQRVGREA
jgi:hypothetical protein